MLQTLRGAGLLPAGIFFLALVGVNSALSLVLWGGTVNGRNGPTDVGGRKYAPLLVSEGRIVSHISGMNSAPRAGKKQRTASGPWSAVWRPLVYCLCRR